MRLNQRGVTVHETHSATLDTSMAMALAGLVELVWGVPAARRPLSAAAA